MAKGFNGELLHAGFVRARVSGSGTFRMTLASLDDVTSETLPTISMSSTPGNEPGVLGGFISQKISLKVEVNAIDEWFNVSKLTIFIRPVATGLPQ